MSTVRLVNRDTGAVVVVPEEKADALVSNFRLERESAPAKKAPAKKASSSKSKK